MGTLSAVARPRSAHASLSHAEVRAGPVQLELLKGFYLTIGRIPMDVPTSSQRLVAFLALQEKPLQRSYIAGTLWANSSGTQSMGCLRSALWRLQSLGRLLVDSAGQCLQLSTDVEVDVRQTVESARRVHRCGVLDSDSESTWIEKLIDSGELLPDWYDDWVSFERERLRQLRLHALDAACTQLAAGGRFGLAVQAGLAAIRSEPMRETSHRSLIQAYLLEGNRSEAARHYRLYCELMRNELGLEPSISLDELGNEVSFR